jgi:hypothetical protein
MAGGRGSESRRSAESRRAKAVERRRAELARERRNRLLLMAAGALGVLALAAVLAFTGFGGSSGSTPSNDSAGEQLPSGVDGQGDTTTQKPAVTIADTSGIPGVVAYAARVGDSNPTGALENSHVPSTVVYSVTPPVGGPHNALWMNCGVYTKPVPSERAVHDLEHGAVWITYRPSLSAAERDTLQTLALKQSKVKDGNGRAWRYMDLTPWASEALPAPIVISAWGRQLKVETASDPRLQRFIDAFRAKKGITPELGSPCGGQPPGVGGRPAVS